MNNVKIIGIDLGATNIRGAVVSGEVMSAIVSRKITVKGTEEQVLEDVYYTIDQLIDKDIKAIGIGVPSVVDVELGIVYDVVHIPSWKEVHLKQILEEKYKVTVFVNNDANCFALGEYYFGKGKGAKNLVGLTLGTGLGAGIIINNQLYAGPNCGAGEFGCVDYLDNNYEFYCSGSFFNNVYGLNGQDVFKDAQNGDANALKLYAELGTHLGNAIKLVMYTYDPSLIILGGSVPAAYDYFEKTMWERIHTLVYPKSVEKLKIETSALENSGILGAAGLYFDSL
ncbi:ROK family protein [Mucilaginibacter sp. BJC16-A38]|uniref:ROK family protein n=1 Tax=Mucilaginibacter phenanthrenivorans TaxID=1234842 RepID=UPI0021579253|nr:ROK family protein [Mucilaginibacter phenanthrenivorans]MCR8556122.1 ROK family protein [Mucilaginibacter phenanthrenivorans]